MSTGFAHFLRRSFISLAEGRPQLYNALGRVLGGYAVGLRIDEEQTGVQSLAERGLVVGAPRSPSVRVFTSGAAILRLIDGEMDLREAVLGGAVDLQGTSDDLIVFDRALHIFMHGAVRVRRIRELLDDYRHEVSRRAAGGSGEEMAKKEGAMGAANPPEDTEAETTPAPGGTAPTEKEGDQNVGRAFPAQVSRNCVTIFGAGVTGLTVAHELVERGFRVQVWERRSDVREPERGCDVGGLACSQWGSVTRPAEVQLSAQPAGDARDKEFWERRQTRAIFNLPYRFFLRWTKDPSELGASEKLELKIEGEGVVKKGGGQGRVQREYTAELRSILVDLVSEVHERAFQVVYAEGVFDEKRYEQVERVLNGGSSERKVEREIRALLAAELDPAEAEKIRKNLRATMPVRPGLTVTIDGPRFTIKGAKETSGELLEETLKLDSEAAIDWIGDDKNIIGVITFRVREYRIPGEHGYRFFPAFYWHLFDTMKRTPLLQAVPKSPVAIAQEAASGLYRPDLNKLEASGRTAYDNLSPAANQAILFADGFRPSLLPRYQAESFEQLLEIVKIGLRGRLELHPPGEPPPPATEPSGLGVTPRDIVRFQLRLAKFISSCEARRRQYERMSWWEFLRADTFSPAFQAGQNEWPRALVAMSALEVDARTHGNAVCQLLIDLTRPRSYRDGVLNGPTSESWLKHWKRYLESQGVEFIHGELRELRWVKDNVTIEPPVKRLFPVVEAFDPRHPRDGNQLPYVMDGYFVVALPVQEAQRIAANIPQDGLPLGRDLLRLQKMPLGTWVGDPDSKEDPLRIRELEEPRSDGSPLRNFHGIQFYFEEALNWLDGHVFYAQSEWGLSSISQLRYWQDRQDWEDGYRGILSVIIGVWDKAGPSGKDAWHTPPEELAAEVWRQIDENIQAELGRKRGRGKTVLPLPLPRAWHLNDDLEWLEEEGHYRNRSPFLISRPGEWASRPGELPYTDSSGAITEGYGMAYGVVLAGTYMKTYTRLTSMEAANESGRHATNSILSHAELDNTKSRATTWPLEDRELPDLQWLKELDDAHFRRGLPHPLDDMRLEQLVVSSFPGVMRGEARPRTAPIAGASGTAQPPPASGVTPPQPPTARQPARSRRLKGGDR